MPTYLIFTVLSSVEYFPIKLGKLLPFKVIENVLEFGFCLLSRERLARFQFFVTRFIIGELLLLGVLDTSHH